MRPSKRRRFRFFSPQKLLGKYPTTRSVEEMDIKKDPNDFKAASLQRCHSMPSVVVTDTMAHSNSQSFGQAGSLIDKVSCCHYLIPQDSEFPAHKYLTLEKTPKALLTSTSSFEEFSEAETVIEESQMVTRGYANVKVYNSCANGRRWDVLMVFIVVLVTNYALYYPRFQSIVFHLMKDLQYQHRFVTAISNEHSL